MEKIATCASGWNGAFSCWFFLSRVVVKGNIMKRYLAVAAIARLGERQLGVRSRQRPEWR